MTQEVGHRGWYSRGYIPHYDGGNMYQVITYRLADSLPPTAITKIMADLGRLTPTDRVVERRKRIEKWLDAGHGCCLLEDPVCARLVTEAWKYFDGIRYDLAAWVVMPNHVHVLAYIRAGWPMGKVVNSWKSYTARQIKAKIPKEAGQAKIWQRGYWDRYIRSEVHFKNTITYILQNPVKAGLVKRATDWPHSSIHTGPSRCRWRPPNRDPHHQGTCRRSSPPSIFSRKGVGKN